MKVSSLYQFLAVFPPEYIHENRQQYDTPCPFCGEGDYVEYLGRRFYGENRMFWIKSNDDPRAVCRQCMSAGRGHHGVYFFRDFAVLFGEDLDVDETNSPALAFDASSDSYLSGEVQLPDLIPPLRRIAFSSAVDMGFWTSLGFTRETVDHFHLGYGRLYASWERGHLIPMDVRTADHPMIGGHYYEARIPNPDVPGKYLKKNSTGAKKYIFWEIAEGKPEDGVLITESPKNQLAHWQMGYLNSVATFGAGVWNNVPDNFRYLWERGYRRLYVVGDNDTAGRSFNAMLIEQALKVGFTCSFLEWEQALPEGYDTADLLRDRGTDAARKYMEENFVEYRAEAPTQAKAEFIPDYTRVDPAYVPRMIDPVSIEEIRGTGERSINFAIKEYLSTYLAKRVYGKGSYKLFAVRPGAGKTYALIQAAEEVARAALIRKFDERHALETLIKDAQAELTATQDEEERAALQHRIGQLINRLDEFSYQSVFWAAQYRDGLANLIATGANPQYYFDFQARSPENCESHDLVTRLAGKGHNLMKYCSDSCPFAERCKKTGYLAQYVQRRQFPIGVHRHQHLAVESALEGYRDLVVIDESFLNLTSTAETLTSDECTPTSATWEKNLADPLAVEAMQHFALGLQHALRFNLDEPSKLPTGELNPSYMISGTAFLRLLDATIRQISEDKWTLAGVMANLSEQVVRSYQANYVEEDDIQPIRLPRVYKVIEREIAEYVENPDHKRPSCLHLVAGKLEAYPMERVHISSNTPVIVADATATMPELYSIALGRDLAGIYAPDVYNNNTEVLAVHGSDWTISNIDRELGSVLRRRVASVVDAGGEVVSLEHLWEDSTITNNRLVLSYLDVITTYALTHERDGLLVVLHKRIRGIIEKLARKRLPRHKLAFAHYGGVRGSNQWKDYAAVLLIGTPRIPYDIIWRRAQAWANMSRLEEPIPFELAYVPTPYDGTNSGHTHINFVHPFAAALVDQVEVGEAIQAQERIRPHSSHDKKQIILFSSRPIGLNITTLEGKTRLLRRMDPASKYSAIAAYAEARLAETGELPSKRELMQQFQCSHKTVTEGLALLEGAELDRSTA